MRPNRPSISSVLAYGLAASMALVAVGKMMSVDVPSLHALDANLPYLAFGTFVVGLAALVFRQPTVMKGAFLSAALLSVVHRSSTLNVEPESLVITPSSYATLEVAQLNADNLQPGAEGLEALLAQRPDIVAVHGLTPVWAEFLADTLHDRYPFQYLYEDFGLQGIGIFAKQPVGTIDSVHIAGAVHVEACLSGDARYRELNLVGVQTEPPLNSSAYLKLRSQLAALADRVARVSEPTIVLGDFNSVPWSNEMYTFQEESALLESRKSVQSTFIKGAPQLFEVPVEHIFYSPQLRCLGYEVMRVDDGYVGSCATFEDRDARPKLASL